MEIYGKRFFVAETFAAIVMDLRFSEFISSGRAGIMGIIGWRVIRCFRDILIVKAR